MLNKLIIWKQQELEGNLTYPCVHKVGPSLPVLTSGEGDVRCVVLLMLDVLSQS